MSKAYDHGARTVWIVNVGDIKPSEIGTTFFFEMAWDINRWNRQTLPNYLPDWAARKYGSNYAPEIAAIMREYFRLNYDRKPEHLQWWLPKSPPHFSPWSADASRQRLRDFAELRRRTEKLQATIPKEKRDAYFELVAYPVTATALANERYFQAELGNMTKATAANTELAALTGLWDTTLAGGKWAHFMNEEPADNLWPSFRISKWTPELALKEAAGERPPIPPAPLVMLEAEAYSARRPRAGANWNCSR
jgi:hypothetical protein